MLRAANFSPCFQFETRTDAPCRKPLSTLPLALGHVWCVIINAPARDAKVKYKSIKNASDVRGRWQRIESEANEVLKSRGAAATPAPAERTTGLRRLCMRNLRHKRQRRTAGVPVNAWTTGMDDDNGDARRQRRRDLLKVSQRNAAATRRPTAAKVAFDIRSDALWPQQHQQQKLRQQRAPITAWSTTIATTTIATANATANNAATTMVVACSSPAQIAASVRQSLRQPLPTAPSSHHRHRRCRTPDDSSKSSRHAARIGCIGDDTPTMVCGARWSSGCCGQWGRHWWMSPQRFATGQQCSTEAQQHSRRTESRRAHLVGWAGDALRRIQAVDDDKTVVRSTGAGGGGTVDAVNRLPMPERRIADPRTSICCRSTTAIGRLLQRFGAHLNEYNFSRSTIQFLGAICQQGKVVFMLREHSGVQVFSIFFVFFAKKF